MSANLEQEAPPQEKARAVLLVHSTHNGQLPVPEAFLAYDWTVHEVYSANDAVAFLKETPLPVAVVERVEDWTALVNAIEHLSHPPCLIVTSRLGDRKAWGGVLELAATMFSLLGPEKQPLP